MKFAKGHNSVKNVDEVMVLVLCTPLMMLYICTKVHGNISVSELLSRHNFHSEIFKGA